MLMKEKILFKSFIKKRRRRKTKTKVLFVLRHFHNTSLLSDLINFFQTFLTTLKIDLEVKPKRRRVKTTKRRRVKKTRRRIVRRTICMGVRKFIENITHSGRRNATDLMF